MHTQSIFSCRLGNIHLIVVRLDSYQWHLYGGLIVYSLLNLSSVFTKVHFRSHL